jgi:hypothetical protein
LVFIHGVEMPPHPNFRIHAHNSAAAVSRVLCLR